MAPGEDVSDSAALEAFLIENRDLERLEALLDRFNIFEAIGVVRQELRHSDFLAFLLDPRANHDLGDLFAKRLLQRVLLEAESGSAPVTPIELELWSLDQMEVHREWQRVDVLLLDKTHELAVIVENKVGTGEHSDQLQRYYKIVEQHFPGWRIVALYLTPGGEMPSHEAYLPVDYGLVCDIIDGLVEGRASVANLDLKTLMSHYTEMLRRHIVGDSEIAELCRQIYQKHQRALDLVYEHRPDVQLQIKDVLEELVRNEPRLKLDHSIKSRIRFVSHEWDAPDLRAASGWTLSRRILLFEFWNDPNRLQLKLMVGPGLGRVRHRLFDMARANPGVFRVPHNLEAKHPALFSRPFLRGGTYEDTSHEEREREIRKRWAEFLENLLPQINAALMKEEWIWETGETSEP